MLYCEDWVVGKDCEVVVDMFVDFFVLLYVVCCDEMVIVWCCSGYGVFGIGVECDIVIFCCCVDCFGIGYECFL